MTFIFICHRLRFRRCLIESPLLWFLLCNPLFDLTPTMSGGQQGLFSSVLGFLSREVQDFVSTATGSSTTEVSVRSFAMAFTIKISLCFIPVCRELSHQQARTSIQGQNLNEKHGALGEKDCMRVTRKAATKRKSGESNSTRFANPPAVFDPPAARHTLQLPPHNAEPTRIRAVLPPHDVKKQYPRKNRLPVAPAERRPRHVPPHLPLTTVHHHHTMSTSTTQTQRLLHKKK